MDGGTIAAIQTVTAVLMLAVTAGALFMLCRLMAMTKRLEGMLAAKENPGKVKEVKGV